MRVPLMKEDPIEEIVRRRVEALLEKDVSGLRALPSSSTESVQAGKKEIKVTTYRDRVDTGSDRVVVQAIRERWGGMTARVVAMGFEVSRSGEKRSLDQEELYDFL
jgi:hypothetical protein